MSEITFYKFKFQTGVHLGEGSLESSGIHLHADTLFSAIFIEAMKNNCEQQLYEAVTSGKLRFSDAFPFYGDRYYLPKPVLRIEASDTGNSLEKKFYKKLQYIPTDSMKAYLSGKMDRSDSVKELYSFSSRTMAKINMDEDTLPFHVGVCSFVEDGGLYIISETESKHEKDLMENLMVSLSAVGIGGKKSAGFGKFQLNFGAEDQTIKRMLSCKKGIKMLLSVALPKEDELEKALEGASYTLLPRSGFVSSDQYAEEQRKKKTLYVFDAGSCFENSFEGAVYDVSNGGNHPVYRYAIPMFAGLIGDEI